jgi:6-pyruvoyltetrahydropterin/6-carboxytetrahydropterin synthase
MAARYTIRVWADFSGAHQLHGYDGPCARMHGHNWKIEAEVEATRLDNIGMGIDFREIRGALAKIIEDLDHQVLNDIPPFTEHNPTAENVAAHFFQRLRDDIGTRHDPQVARISAVTLWETDRSSVRYCED